MSVFAFGNTADHWKPDSGLSNSNGDNMSFATYATIDTSAALLAGDSMLSCQLDVLKGDARGRCAFRAGALTNEIGMAFLMKPVIDGTFSTPTLANTIFKTNSVAGAGKYVEMNYLKNGASTTTILLRFLYDGTQVGTDQVITIGNIYRVAVYVKLGTLGAANSTYSVYLDDVTAGMAVGFVATQVITTATATFTNSPSGMTVMEFGTNSGSSSNFGNFIFKFGHWWCIDTAAGGTFTDPVNRVTQPIFCSLRGVAVSPGFYTGWTGDASTQTVEAVPDDATTVITAVMAHLDPDKLTSWTVTPWATVGNSTGDEIGCVRVSGRGTTGDGSVGQRFLLREGGVDVLNGTYMAGAAWVTFVAGTNNAGIPFQHTPPGSGGTWTPGLYNGVQMGCVVSDLGIVPPATWTSKNTWMRVDALYVKKVALSLGGRRRFAQGY